MRKSLKMLSLVCVVVSVSAASVVADEPALDVSSSSAAPDTVVGSSSVSAATSPDTPPEAVASGAVTFDACKEQGDVMGCADNLISQQPDLDDYRVFINPELAGTPADADYKSLVKAVIWRKHTGPITSWFLGHKGYSLVSGLDALKQVGAIRTPFDTSFIGSTSMHALKRGVISEDLASALNQWQQLSNASTVKATK